MNILVLINSHPAGFNFGVTPLIHRLLYDASTRDYREVLIFKTYYRSRTERQLLEHVALANMGYWGIRDVLADRRLDEVCPV